MSRTVLSMTILANICRWLWKLVGLQDAYFGSQGAVSALGDLILDPFKSGVITCRGADDSTHCAFNVMHRQRQGEAFKKRFSESILVSQGLAFGCESDRSSELSPKDDFG